MHRLKIVYLKNYYPDWPQIEHHSGDLCFDLRAAIPHPLELFPVRVETELKVYRVAHPGGKLSLFSFSKTGHPVMLPCDSNAHISVAATLISPPTVRVPLGVAFDFEDDQALELHPRSGLSSRDIILTNGESQIDCSYRGQVMAPLKNLSSTPHTIEPGERIIQARVTKRVQTTFYPISAEDLSATARGSGGFGSSGRF